MKVKKVKASALLMLPTLTVMAASLQAADVTPVWVEYTPASAIPSAPPPATPAVATPATVRVAAETTAPAAPAATAPAAPNEQPALMAAPTVGAPPANSNSNVMTVNAVVTPRIYAFDYFKGVGDNQTHYLERYDYRDGMIGDQRSGGFADIDLSLGMNNGDRDVFVIERQGFGLDNHRGMAKFDDDEITLSGSYSHYRSTTGGIDYLFSPAVVPGAGTAPYPGANPPNYFSGNLPFTNNTGTTDYHIDRTTYAAGFKIKPSLLGGSATLDVNYEGYKREGNQLATTVVMAGGGGNPTIDSWRGINLAVDERMNKFSVTLGASPGKLFNVAYDISLEKFTNQAPDLTRNNIMGTNGSDRQDRAPFYFVPDTSLLAQNIRLSKNVGNRAVIAAGYGFSTLKDENSPERFTATYGGSGGPDTWEGEINSSNAYLTGNMNVSPTVSVEGHIKYTSRDNDSSFPVQHVIAPTGPNARMAGPRIDSIDSMDYGLATNWRPGIMQSNVTLGWQRIDRERGLTYGAYTEAIPANRIFYREDTLSDEVYLKWIARPAQGVSLHLNPSYTWSDKTGLTTEPERALKVKTMLSYGSPNGWLASGFYDYKNRKNNDLYVTGDTTGAGVRTYQDVDDTFHSAGVTLNMMPSEAVNTSVSLFWMQNDLASYFLSTDAVRQQQINPVAFATEGLSRYKIDSYVLSLGADWQAKEKLKLSGSYTLSQNKGDTASGEVLLALQGTTGTIDSRIDNTLHSISLGADYTLSPKATLRANYAYDYYDDSAYSLLTGGVNMLAIGVSFKL